MITVDLDDLSGMGDADRGDGLVFPWPSTVVWTRQAGGTACAHPACEGIYVPLPVADVLPFAYELRPDWGLSAARDACQLDEVDAAFAAARYPLVVDRRRLDPRAGQNYGEAWLPVLVVDRPGCFPAESPRAALRGFLNSPAILTWPNSD